MKIKAYSAEFDTRENTGDDRVVQEVFVGNAYSFPDDMKKKIVIDVGAHIGTASIAAAMRGAHVFAIEPSKDNFMQLKINISKNNLNNEIDCYNWAVGTPGIRKFYLNPENPASNVLKGFENEKYWNYDFVSVVSISDIIKGFEISKCDYLKLDCEGAEREIIDDIVNYHHLIDNIVAELHSDETIEMYKNYLSNNYIMEKIHGYSNHYEYSFKHK